MEGSVTWTVISGAALLLLLVLSWPYLTGSRHALPLPPGPKPLPLLGNLLDVPKHFAWVRYKEWADQFGAH
jgi:hypothetical protein